MTEKNRKRKHIKEQPEWKHLMNAGKLPPDTDRPHRKKRKKYVHENKRTVKFKKKGEKKRRKMKRVRQQEKQDTRKTSQSKKWGKEVEWMEQRSNGRNKKKSKEKGENERTGI